MPKFVEIEKKWMVKGWPEGLDMIQEEMQRQGYLAVEPTVRIREEAIKGGKTSYIVCFKSKGKLSRKEVEVETDKEHFEGLEEMIGLPLIDKVRRTYKLPNGMKLEVNNVDEGQKTHFWYAEIEFESEEEARSFDPASVGLSDYLNDDVTDQPGQSMGAYWSQTRVQ